MEKPLEGDGARRGFRAAGAGRIVGSGRPILTHILDIWSPKSWSKTRNSHCLAKHFGGAETPRESGGFGSLRRRDQPSSDPIRSPSSSNGTLLDSPLERSFNCASRRPHSSSPTMTASA